MNAFERFKEVLRNLFILHRQIGKKRIDVCYYFNEQSEDFRMFYRQIALIERFSPRSPSLRLFLRCFLFFEINEKNTNRYLNVFRKSKTINTHNKTTSSSTKPFSFQCRW